MTWTITAGTLATGVLGSTSCPVPSGITSGDLLVMVVMVDSSSAPSSISGWTQVTAGIARCSHFYKIASGGESAVSLGYGTVKVKTQMYRCSPVDPITPYDTGDFSALSTVSITASHNDCLAIITTTESAGTTTTKTPPSGFTTLFSDTADSFFGGAAYKVIPAGSTGALTYSGISPFRHVLSGFNILASNVSSLFFGSNF